MRFSATASRSASIGPSGRPDKLGEHAVVGPFGLARLPHLLAAVGPHHPQVESALVRLAVGDLDCHALVGFEGPVYLLPEREEAGPVARDLRRGVALSAHANDACGRPHVLVGDFVLGAFSFQGSCDPHSASSSVISSAPSRIATNSTRSASSTALCLTASLRPGATFSVRVTGMRRGRVTGSPGP